ncbi:HutD/Ves family protein [Aminipila terrae]|uniref:HutD family protein n=1 Tax=Aminipila terrae TaxID=2697030 RepID=A0A6P1MG12_9FIRM|nr:HutD family protein [Aminipila terrae]QHI72992.1 hypothetical protein Ami3637_11775 [Aminipila terrae]
MCNINYKKYGKQDYKIGKWSGGITTELAIYPENFLYNQRKFIWRLSSASVDVEKSDFTPLPDYDRVLIVLHGEVVLSHKKKRVIRLAQYEQDRFSGTYKTRSFGKITDFNLMVRKGNQGFAQVITLTKESVSVQVEIMEGYKKMSHGFYCAEGKCKVNFHKEECLLEAGELLIINSDYGSISQMNLSGEGKTIWTHMYYNENEI